MRPGLLCPGKEGNGRQNHGDGPRFNEAGAVMPRKGGGLILSRNLKARLQ